MFHVKPYIMIQYARKCTIAFIISFFSFYCFSQKAGDMSVGLSLDYSFGKNFNNYASTLRFNYNLFERIRISPAFSSYLKKEDVKMKAFSLNVHYLLPQGLWKDIPQIENQEIKLYPITGIYVSNISATKKYCANCSAYSKPPKYSYALNFGFNFGAGIEYKLPTLQPFLRNTSLGFEVQYHVLDGYERPSLLFGFIYNL